ncbi:hypothetical protein GGU10DRAFT_391037 [Lentinula aff. detonsa]|uniref:Uncharacterized protein n=1 Tax=Lentinula aff. detonsa TaxID=2804958 RepID=A0AA38L2Z6_9AGAR|nr:hypothetical protein GGU10DRAFT_391037 [Lentinula aff. detonsa]
MSGDVNERPDILKRSQHQKGRESNVLFSRIRNFNQTFSSIGSLFSNGNSNVSGMNNRFEHDGERLDEKQFCNLTSERRASATSQGFYHDQNRCTLDSLKLGPPFEILDIDTPTPTRPGTPHNIDRMIPREEQGSQNNLSSNILSQPRSSIGTKLQFNARQHNIYHGDPHNYRNSEDLNGRNAPIFYTASPSGSLTVATSSSSSSHSLSSNHFSVSSMLSSLNDTPPLSPDSASFGTNSSISQLATDKGPPSDMRDQFDQYEERHAIIYPQERPKLEEIREGKKPERTICPDTLIDHMAEEDSSDHQTNDQTPIDDTDEWYGLEYTLELSCKERRASETYSCDEHVGESSRSHESWAALRRGTIHPFFEDKDYHQWKNWHKHLDREDERRRHRRGLEFKARSKDLAWYHLNEMRTREVMYWQLEVYGMVGPDVKDRLATLGEHRRDPYHPPKKHHLGWYLKRSRSVACLRELQPKSTLKLISRGGRPVMHENWIS